MDELVPVEEESVEKILARLMEPDAIAMKTEYGNPLNITRLHAIADWLQEEQMMTSAALLREFIKNYSMNMVSKGREGRKEIVRAIENKVDDISKRNRWTGRGGNEGEDIP